MVALTKQQMRDTLLRRFQNRSALSDQIDDALTIAQQRLETGGLPDTAGGFLPWFLVTDNKTIVTVAGNDTVTLPTGFLREEEEFGGFFIKTSAGTWKQLVKDDFNVLNNAELGAGVPTSYALVGENMILFPTPAAIETLRGMYFAEDSALEADNETNKWSKYASSLLIAGAGYIVAQNVRYPSHMTEFAAEMQALFSALTRAHTARMEAMRDASMGDN